ncbi:PKD domain-containing protein [Isoalcanivorax beigongshangi]|uniref:Ig-like domain-containing protein n=1 Tax=Isoalcanivorax beigongshangi TaxID=3238810 RepID=A0ABV4AI79_9GAMM
MTRFLPLIGTLGLSLMVTACGSSSSSSSAPTPPKAEITLLSPADTTFSLGQGPVTVQLDGSHSSSPRDATLSYSWNLVAAPTHSNAQLDNSDGTLANFKADLPGAYVASLTVDDGSARSTATRITLDATSPYPTASSATHYSVRLGTDSLGLDASASTPPTGESGPLDYKWSLGLVPEGSGAYLTQAEQALATLHLDLEGDYHLRLVVSYQGTESAPVEVRVTVSSGNAPPVAVADDITITRGSEVVLDGSRSYDPDGEPLEYRWRWASTATSPKHLPIPELQGTNTDTLRFTPEAVGNYYLVFSVFDGTWKSEEQTVTVTVQKPADADNLPPVGDLITVAYFPTNSVSNQQEVGLRANFVFEGYDPDGDAIEIIDAELVSKPAGSNATLDSIGAWEPLGRKIQVLDKVGDYQVRMTLSDGTHTITRDATMTALVGNVNRRPDAGGIDMASGSVLVGNPLVFTATSKDPDLDPLTFTWELVDRPDNSQAVIVPVLEPESREYRRAHVVTDVPGPYRVRVQVKDDRGLEGITPREVGGMAKLSNSAPEIRYVSWQRNWGSLAPGQKFVQLLPCMSLLFRPVVVDLDGDSFETREQMLSAPEGGDYTSLSYAQDACPNMRGNGFTQPGTYVFRYEASDGIDDAKPYDFTVEIEPMANARGVLLRNLDGDGDALLHPLPYENLPPYGYDFVGRPAPVTKPLQLAWSLEALDSDYTIVDVETRHINGGLASLTPWFEGLEEGTVIRQGDSLSFQTWLPAVPCLRTDDMAEGYHLSFRIKELPDVHFIYENWIGGRKGILSQWQECAPGELE